MDPPQDPIPIMPCPCRNPRDRWVSPHSASTSSTIGAATPTGCGRWPGKRDRLLRPALAVSIYQSANECGATLESVHTSSQQVLLINNGWIAIVLFHHMLVSPMFERFPPFRPADAAKFRERAQMFASFVDWDAGRLWAAINSETAFNQMVAFTSRGLPAVAGITHILDPFLIDIDDRALHDPEAGREADQVRRAVGSMIREVMEANGYRKTGKLRAVPPEPRRIFVRAEVFERAPLPREPKPFDWDRYVMGAPFHQVRQLSPELGNRRLPSMYSPDRAWFYISSLDLDVACGDPQRVEIALLQMRDMYRSRRNPDLSPLKAFVMDLDLQELEAIHERLTDEPSSS